MDLPQRKEFLKILFQFKNLLKRVDLMCQQLKMLIIILFVNSGALKSL